MNRTGTAISRVAVSMRARSVMEKLLMSRRRHKDFPHGPSQKIPARGAGRQGARTPQYVSNAAHPTPGSTKAQAARSSRLTGLSPYIGRAPARRGAGRDGTRTRRVVVAGRQDVLDSKRGKAKRVIPRNEGSR